jgi:hypothetical protein
VARHFHPAPFARQPPLLVDQERAALDAADLSPVEQLVFHHAEQLADRLLGVRQQLEGEFQLGLEGFMRPQRVARDAVDLDADPLEIAVESPEVGPLLGAARGVVLRIEVERQLFAAPVGESEGAAAGRGKPEIRDRLAERDQRF